MLAAHWPKRRAAHSVPFYLVALDLVAQIDCMVTMSERIARAQEERFRLQVVRPLLQLERYALSQVSHPCVDRALPAVGFGISSREWRRRLSNRFGILRCLSLQPSGKESGGPSRIG
jgi:hypothetical protein